MPNNHFEAALMLGPMYHLQSEEDRVQALKELYRVTKPEGLVFIAFMSKTKFLTTSIMDPEIWKPNHTAHGIEAFLQSGLFNHADQGRFTGAFYFDIDEIIPFMESNGFTTEKLIGSGSIAGSMNQEQWEYWKQRGEDEFKTIWDIIIKESENPYILGSSSHLLYIGRKK